MFGKKRNGYSKSDIRTMTDREYSEQILRAIEELYKILKEGG